MNAQPPRLVDFIPLVSPEFRPPYHQQDWCEQIEACVGRGGVRALNAKPIRHHKTRTTLHGIAWLLVMDPTINIVYMVQDHKRAEELASILLHIIAQAAEKYGSHIAPARGSAAKLRWKNERGGGAHLMSYAQSDQGGDVDVLICDDPISEIDVKVLPRRDEVDDAINNYTMRVGRPSRPGSVLILMSRWHPNDPIGRRLTRAGWTYLRSSAIIDEGLVTERAFCPEVMTLEDLYRRRAEEKETDPTERRWWAQFQQDPRAPGLSKFRPDPARYSELPPWDFRLAYGVDMAYTSEVESDFFALVVMKVCGRKGYILDVQRHKIDAHMIESTLKRAMGIYGRAPIYSYMSGPEIGTARLLREHGVPIQPMTARWSKLVRAEKTVARWNDLEILVPEQAAWVPGFLARTEEWRGYDKAYGDDEIDALVSVCDAVIGGTLTGNVKSLGRAYPGMFN